MPAQNEPLPSFSSRLNESIKEIKSKIKRRGNLPFLSVEKQLDYLHDLLEFPLGRALIESRCFDAFWTDYIMIGTENRQVSKLENFILSSSPFIKAWRELFLIFQNIIQSKLKNNIKIASIPCGNMRDLLELDYSKLFNFDIVGIDIDEETLSSAHKLALSTPFSTHAHFVKEDAWHLTYNEEFDIIASCGLNIYESDKDKNSELYRQFFKALKPGGTLIISFLTPPPYERLLQSEWDLSHIHFDDIDLEKILFKDILELKYRNFTSSKEFQSQLEDVGFEHVQFRYDSARIFPAAIASKHMN